MLAACVLSCVPAFALLSVLLAQLVNKAAAKFDQMQLTSFLDAAANGDVDAVQDMLRQGMNPNTADYDGRTGLMIAAYKGRKVGFDWYCNLPWHSATQHSRLGGFCTRAILLSEGP